jgi:hypothetical protein
MAAKSQAEVLYDTAKGPIAAYGVLTCLYVYSIPGKYIWFSWHPLAMIVGMIVLAANAALIKKVGGYENTKIHGYMMSGAVALAAFGFYVIYSNKEMSSKAHFTTLHGKVGYRPSCSSLAREARLASSEKQNQ